MNFNMNMRRDLLYRRFPLISTRDTMGVGAPPAAYGKIARSVIYMMVVNSRPVVADGTRGVCALGDWPSTYNFPEMALFPAINAHLVGEYFLQLRMRIPLFIHAGVFYSL